MSYNITYLININLSAFFDFILALKLVNFSLTFKPVQNNNHNLF
jgi:hypothetical protein